MADTLFLMLAAAIGTAGSAPALDSGAIKSNANAAYLAKNYPVESLRRGEQGRVAFQLSFEADGTLTGCTVTQSSGFRTLDEGTCEMLAKSAKIEPARDADGRRVPSVKAGYIDWKLPLRTVQVAQSNPAVVTADNPLVCKKTSVPGSIIKKIKRCMTKSEWQLHERLTQQEVRRAMDTNICSDHGC
jgi:TonB family protein